jgi:hypothetical protein
LIIIDSKGSKLVDFEDTSYYIIIDRRFIKLFNEYFKNIVCFLLDSNTIIYINNVNILTIDLHYKVNLTISTSYAAKGATFTFIVFTVKELEEKIAHQLREKFIPITLDHYHSKPFKRLYL